MIDLNKQESENEITNFGFCTVTKNQKTKMVANVFHSVANKYDLMNDLMSFGIHRIWKKFTICYSGVQRGQKVLDLAGGTGDITIPLSKIVGDNGIVVLADINESMLKIGRDKIRNLGIISNVMYLLTNAEILPFSNNTFDCIIISFGLRNITEKEKTLSDIYRILKPGGRLIILEFSMPVLKLLKKAYNIYSFYILPVIGYIVANNYSSYRYLVESISLHPDQEKLKMMIIESGFCHVNYINMTGGIVAMHRGYKF